MDAFAAAEALVIAPSNPHVSIQPILAVEQIRAALVAPAGSLHRGEPARSGGRAVKGPADRMLRRMAGGTEPRHVAQCYEGLIDALVVDESDLPAEADVPLVGARGPDDGSRGEPPPRGVLRGRGV